MKGGTCEKDFKSRREKIMRLAAPIKIGVPALIILAIAAVIAFMALGSNGVTSGVTAG